MNLIAPLLVTGLVTAGVALRSSLPSPAGPPAATPEVAVAPRPAAVDHSLSRHFPPIGRQRAGDCTCWSSCYYYNTYTQARDHGLDASTGDPKVVNSPRFLFSQISQGHGGAEATEYVMEHLARVGCAPVALHPMNQDWRVWPGEAARIAALRNRPGPIRKVRADTVAGLEEVKRHIAAGGCAVTRGLFRANYPLYGRDCAGPGIDNGVMYAKTGRNWLRHSLCICGYDDNRTWRDHRDGSTRSGAFLIANSEGPKWGSYNSSGKGTRGFIWVAYSMFLAGDFGRYDNDDNPRTDPCYDNPPHPMIYFHQDRPRYRPRLYAVAAVDHDKRNRITFTGGIGPARAPLFVGPQVVRTTRYGDLPVRGDRRLVVDLTDGARLLATGEAKRVFLRLDVHATATRAGTLSRVELFHDPHGSGRYRRLSAGDKSVTVAPGKRGHIAIELGRGANGRTGGEGATGKEPRR